LTFIRELKISSRIGFTFIVELKILKKSALRWCCACHVRSESNGLTFIPYGSRQSPGV
jgi:hypothetical protein